MTGQLRTELARLAALARERTAGFDRAEAALLEAAEQTSHPR